jgi:hypothetical protein
MQLISVYVFDSRYEARSRSCMKASTISGSSSGSTTIASFVSSLRSPSPLDPLASPFCVRASRLTGGVLHSRYLPNALRNSPLAASNLLRRAA